MKLQTVAERKKKLQYHVQSLLVLYKRSKKVFWLFLSNKKHEPKICRQTISFINYCKGRRVLTKKQTWYQSIIAKGRVKGTINPAVMAYLSVKKQFRTSEMLKALNNCYDERNYSRGKKKGLNKAGLLVVISIMRRITVSWACKRDCLCECKSWRIETPRSSVSSMVLRLSLILSLVLPNLSVVVISLVLWSADA